MKLFDTQGNITCPRCKEKQNLLKYKRLQFVEDAGCVPVLKCISCNYVFAPDPGPIGISILK